MKRTVSRASLLIQEIWYKHAKTSNRRLFSLFLSRLIEITLFLMKLF